MKYLVTVYILLFTFPAVATTTSAGIIVESASEGVRIEFKDSSLGETLRSISKASGIKFQVPEAMEGDLTTVSIHVKDWPSAISQLLEGFNVVAVWNEDLSKSRITILNYGNGTETTNASAKEPPGEQSLRWLKVNGSSMQPTLNPGDRVQWDADYFQTHSPQKGDLVAIKFQSRKRMMVKRVLAIPGDHVEMASGRLSVNGAKPRTLSGKSSRSRVLSLQLKRYGNRVPENNFLVMGDNTGRSFDSADYGFVSYNQLAGKIIP